MQDNSRKRHIAKAITWRIVGTIDTIILSWIISGDPLIGLENRICGSCHKNGPLLFS